MVSLGIFLNIQDEEENTLGMAAMLFPCNDILLYTYYQDYSNSLTNNFDPILYFNLLF